MNENAAFAHAFFDKLDSGRKVPTQLHAAHIRDRNQFVGEIFREEGSDAVGNGENMCYVGSF